MNNGIDVVIVGCGVGGLYTALNIPMNRNIAIIAKGDCEECDSYLAQGGICMLRDEDDYDAYFNDTMRAGHYENDPRSVDLMIRGSQDVIKDLIGYGVDFQRKEDGELDFTREGAHSQPRILYHEDITGEEITKHLLAAVRRLPNVKIYEHVTMVDILTAGEAGRIGAAAGSPMGRALPRSEEHIGYLGSERERHAAAVNAEGHSGRTASPLEGLAGLSQGSSSAGENPDGASAGTGGASAAVPYCRGIIAVAPADSEFARDFGVTEGGSGDQISFDPGAGTGAPAANGSNAPGPALTDKGEQVCVLHAPEVVWACGGIGGLFEHSTNFPQLTGDALAISLKHGIRLENPDYIQIHPTSFYSEKPGRSFLVSESVRGEGGILLNEHGRRFVNELLPRDVVSNAIFREMAEEGTKHVWLSMERIPKDVIVNHFKHIYEHGLEEGYDCTKEPIPVVPAQHYFMGGVWVDTDSRTSMDHLYAVGETSCNGVHGKNRLASNSLLESLVFAKRAAHAITEESAQVTMNLDQEEELDLKLYENSKDLEESYREAVLGEIERMKQFREQQKNR